MEMLSVLGNLIVLGIVSVVLVLFRKTDKNSKSLEQVKKYASKRNEEFDLYVEERISNLKDLSISLEVQEKTGAVILNRIAGEVDQLSEKIERIEELNKKVVGYNSTMDKMLNLSKELDERYSGLKKDSLFLEQVDKKVRDSKKKLGLIEKSIDDIATEFIENNNRSINKLKDSIYLQSKELTEELGERINKSSLYLDDIDSKVNELSNNYNTTAKLSYDNFKEDLNKLLENHRNTVLKITQDGEDLENSSFTEIKNKIDQRSSTLVQLLENKLLAIEEENKSKISQLSMDMGNVELIANNIKEENKQRLDSIKDQIDKQLGLIKELNSVGVKELQEEFKINFNEFRSISISEIEKTKRESETLLTDINDKLTNVKEYRDEVVNNISSVEEYVEGELSEIKDRVDSSVYDVTRSIQDKENEIRKAATDKIASSIESYKKDIELKLGDLEGVKREIESTKESLYDSILGIKDDVKLEFKELNSNILEKKTSIFSELDNIKEDVSKQSKENEALLNNEKESMLRSLESLKQNNDKLKEDLIGNEKEIREQVKLQRDRLISSVDADLTSKLDEIRSEFLDKINTFTDFDEEINSAKEKLEAHMKQIHGALEKDIDQFHEKLNQKMDDEKSVLNLFTEEFNRDKVELELEINKLKERSFTNISEKLDLFEDDYFAKLRERESLIDVETDSWRNKLGLYLREYGTG